MPLYTFYPCRPDGESLTFDSQDLPDDAAAEARARIVCEAHESCSHVAVWAGERRVLTFQCGDGTGPRRRTRS